MKYQITKIQCKKQIPKGNICDGCGGYLEPIETIDNSWNPTYWAGCRKCHVFTTGATKKIFKIARKLVKKGRLEPYTHDTMIQFKESKNRFEKDIG